MLLLRTIYVFVYLFLCSTPLLLRAQSVPLGAGNEQAETLATDNVQASDGDYDKFVLIRWNAGEKSTGYRLFRAQTAKGASMVELTKGWQKSNWFCDYSAEKGREYYYAIMENEGNNSTALSRFDKGYVRKTDPGMAQDELLSTTSTDKYAEGWSVFMLISDVVPDTNTCKAGASLPVRIGLQNIFEEATVKTDLRFYLSNDATWDIDDTLLGSKTFSGFPADSKVTLSEKVDIPANTLRGTYHLLAVALPEGKILQAKTGVAQIKVESP